jgi:scytalone dehydratase
MWEAMPADDFVAMASNPAVLGDPTLMTQHFCGASKYEKVSDDEIVGWHQLRVPHQKYTDESRKEIAVKGHAHSTNQHWYKRVDGVWKFAGLCPNIRWFEYDFDKVFESGRESFGEEQEKKVEESLAKAANGIPTEITTTEVSAPVN